VTNPI
jgi:hypothetical protein